MDEADLWILRAVRALEERDPRPHTPVTIIDRVIRDTGDSAWPKWRDFTHHLTRLADAGLLTRSLGRHNRYRLTQDGRTALIDTLPHPKTLIPRRRTSLR